jgi:uncharacterized membrane protein
MMKYNIKYLISSIVLIALDSLYLYFSSDYFSQQIKRVQGSKINIHMGGAVLTYIVLIFGINYFIIREHRSITEAALLGGVIYFVYEGTNLALFDHWRILTVLMDGLWGSILFGLTTAITYRISN